MAGTKISEIISESLSNIRTVADANTIIGSPIETPSGTTIIPVSKLSVGLASGGLDLDGKGKREAGKADSNQFGGGGGTGMTVTPVAFLVIHPDGNVELMNVSNPTSKPADLGYNVSSLLDHIPEITEKLKAFFANKKKKSADDADDEEAEADSGETAEDGSET
ncbi:MAG: sporulation protein YtfJ [Clostridia bacterium]|nr:sporulation protein YtfJ [Clostridia bacterium]